MVYNADIERLLSPSEQRIFRKLSSPNRIQDFLESLPIHFNGEGILSPREVLKQKRAHCIEGAVFAAAVLAYHNSPPLLMDFQTHRKDEDHVITLFKIGRYWGAISKTNHPVLRWRDPIYSSPRELAMTFFHEFYFWYKKDGKAIGKKTLETYSKPFDLRRYPYERWIIPEGNLNWLAEELDISPHFPIVPRSAKRYIRRATAIEMEAMKLEEWHRPKHKSRL